MLEGAVFGVGSKDVCKDRLDGVIGRMTILSGVTHYKDRQCLSYNSTRTYYSPRRDSIRMSF